LYFSLYIYFFFLFSLLYILFISLSIFIRLTGICARAITATHRDYSTWIRWGRSSRSRRSNNCSSNSSNSSDQCLRRVRLSLRVNLRFRRKRFRHQRPLRPISFHQIPIPVHQTRLPSIGCNGLRLHLLQRPSCQVRITSYIYLNISGSFKLDKRWSFNIKTLEIIKNAIWRKIMEINKNY